MMFNKEKYINSGVIKNYFPYITQVSNKFYRNHQINFLSYIKQYDNGKSVQICTNIDWLEYYCANFNTNKSVLPRLTIGSNFWYASRDPAIKNMHKSARDHFSIIGVIEFVYRDNIQGCFHLHSFHTDPANEDKAHMFCLRHKAKLLRMIADFNNKGYQYLNEDAENEIATQTMGYSIKKNQIESVKGFTDLLEEKLYFKLSDYEMEIITLYAAGGFTANQIAACLNKSSKTIEYHISQIRNKTNLKDRKAMNAYVREKGWDGLVGLYSHLGTTS